MKQEIRLFLSKIGKRGGKAGTGEAKKHGRTSDDYRQQYFNSDYYQNIVLKRKKK